MHNAADKYSEAVVLRVNELFHDLTSQQYQRDVESEMLVTESGRWKKGWISSVAPSRETRGMNVLDIGTGTGFVPLSIEEFLDSRDRLVCSDVSESILELARQNLKKQNVQCATEFVKLSTAVPFRLPFSDEEFDVVTMNSVLHHLKDTQGFLSEVNRILKPKGVLFIGHEPNARFRQNLLLRLNFQIFRFLFLPREAIVMFLRKTGLYSLALKFYYTMKPGKKEKANEIADSINRILLKENLIRLPLKPEEIPAITDIRDAEGFDPEAILPSYRLLSLESYNYLLTVSLNKPKHPFVQKYSHLLLKKFPGQGGTFFAVYKK